MILKCILLALSASIDALSLGITYGIKKTKMSRLCNIIIFITLFITTNISILIGHYISIIFSPTFSTCIGSSLLILLGIYTIFKSQNNISTNFNTTNFNYIDKKEAFILALAVAIDASCISLSSGMIGFTGFILPIFMAFFHTFFVNCGNYISTIIVTKLKISNKHLSITAGAILVFIGLLKIL